MPRVKFAYNLEKDAWSWVVIAKSKNLWGLDWRSQIPHIPNEILSKILKTNFSNAVKLTEKYIKKETLQNLHKAQIIRNEIESLEKSWRVTEKRYFKIIETVMQKPIFTERFGCFLTTGFMCPYDEKDNSFMVSMWHSVPFSITTICHEIMHLQFLHYYKQYLKNKGLKNEQIENLKETLTFILNEPEFSSIILSQDSGYPEHRTLRKRLSKIWKREKDFQKFLDKAILEVKKA